MAVVGRLGGLVFRVHSSQVLTFNKMQRSLSGRWSQYDAMGAKPVSVFQGPELQEITFTVILDASLGTRPVKLLELLERMVEKGEVNLLIIGNRRIGRARWRIVKSSEAWNRILSDGKLKRAEVTLTLQEYV